MKSNPNITAITLGDPCGIGPEVTAKALARARRARYDLGRILLIGDWEVYRRYANVRDAAFADLNNFPPQQLTIGTANPHSARAALDYLDYAVGLLRKRKITSLVTAPVSKEAIAGLGVKFSGHTEYLAEAFHVKKFGMMFIADQLKTVIVTRHIPLKAVNSAVTAESVFSTLTLGASALRKKFKIKNPKIAVCGLNPHAGEGGEIGTEEITAIIPAVRKARRGDLAVEGPFSADTLFVPAIARRYDLVVAMYHDQGLIPVKTLYFSSVVNLTIGLPFIRTSPAHGTAFDIAGKNKADPSSMLEAIRLAARLGQRLP